jgi:glycosyltransferase involved in cell wall biosynthesis
MGPIRVLQVFGRMVCAGAETWMLHVVRNIDRARFQLDFLVHSNEPGELDDALRSLGCRVIPCGAPQRPWAYARGLLDVLRRHGPYDAVHSHVHHYSGFVLAVASRAGVPVRIAHSHLDTRGVDASAGPARRAYVAGMRALVRRFATDGLAASDDAGAALFGAGWGRDARWRILCCALDLSPFGERPAPDEVRRSVGLSRDDFVIGHVGRLDLQKNHAFLLRAAAEVFRREPTARLLLVGEGPLRAALERQAAALGIADRVRFAGVRRDVARLMLGAMDVFAFPSLFEGLGLAGVEAQAAGLPVVVSDQVPRAIAVARELVAFVPLAAGESAWAEALLATRGAHRDRGRALAQVLKSPFALPAGLPELARCYAGDAAAERATMSAPAPAELAHPPRASP